MPKLQKEFPHLSSDQLVKITEETLKSLSSYGWKIKKKEQKENNIQWVVEVSGQLWPGFSFFIDLFARTYFKLLIVKVSDHQILVECKEKLPFYFIDWSNEKNKILDEFFTHLDSMMRFGTISLKIAKKRKFKIVKSSIIGFLIIMLAIVLLALMVQVAKLFW